MNFNPNRRVPVRIITVYHPSLTIQKYRTGNHSTDVQNRLCLTYLNTSEMASLKGLSMARAGVFMLSTTPARVGPVYQAVSAAEHQGE